MWRLKESNGGVRALLASVVPTSARGQLSVASFLPQSFPSPGEIKW
jgi:hypothetical protein